MRHKSIGLVGAALLVAAGVVLGTMGSDVDAKAGSPGTFIVFFDFGRFDLTPKAQHIVAEAVKAARSGDAVRIIVTGHADKEGSTTHDQGLSERRAQSVKTEMVRLGLDADDITTVGRGFKAPLIPTGPDVHETQNRRAVIELSR
jgi:outer membrane protein OmpA-like peptidoglycan-associated protein